MAELEHKYFASRGDFRKWLEKNHDSSQGIWMVYYKKHLKSDCIEYSEALEEALCFGWIDSIIKKADDDHYLRKFTPRTDFSKWSDVNKRLVLSLISQGRMTEAGLRKIDVYLKTGRVDWDVSSPSVGREKKELLMPGFVIDEFGKNEPALTNFNSMAATYKRHYILWITSAKREETIQGRVKEAIELLKENRKLGLK